MTTGWSAAEANQILDDALAQYPWIKLHVGDPGSAGTSNAAGNTTRQQATYGAASGGAASNSGAVTWTSVSTTEDYTHFSAWTASSAGSFGFSGTVTANAVTAGDDFVFPIGDIDVSVTTAA